MAMNLDKMTEREEIRAAEEESGSILKFKEGYTLLLLHPESEGFADHESTDGFPFLELMQIYKLGPDEKGIAVCLDRVKNPIIGHPRVVELVANRDKDAFDLDAVESCPVLDAQKAGMTLLETPKKVQCWGATVLGHRSSLKEKWAPPSVLSPGIIMANYTIHKGLIENAMEALRDLNRDITDPEGPIYMVIERTGADFRTKYKVTPDKMSMAEPTPVSDEVREMIVATTAADGDCNLLKFAAGLIKSPARIEAMLEGGDFDEGKPAQRGRATPPPARTAARPAAPASKPGTPPAGKAAAPTTKPAATPAAKPATRPAAKPPVVSVPEEEEAPPEDADYLPGDEPQGEEQGEAQEDEAPPPPPPPARRPASSPAPKPAAMTARSNAARAAAPKAPPPAATQVVGDEGLDDIEAEMAAISGNKGAKR